MRELIGRNAHPPSICTVKISGSNNQVPLYTNDTREKVLERLQSSFTNKLRAEEILRNDVLRVLLERRRHYLRNLSPYFEKAQALGDDMFAKVVDHVKCRSHSCIVQHEQIVGQDTVDISIPSSKIPAKDRERSWNVRENDVSLDDVDEEAKLA
ncbi:hypothetical protein GUITHDRAFT_152804, partial [Guillardia theta CCMP2712]